MAAAVQAGRRQVLLPQAMPEPGCQSQLAGGPVSGPTAAAAGALARTAAAMLSTWLRRRPRQTTASAWSITPIDVCSQPTSKPTSKPTYCITAVRLGSRGSLGLGCRPRRRGAGSGGLIKALERMCSGTSSAC
jgi:hypothetical protein